jgi:hypothetical protein
LNFGLSSRVTTWSSPPLVLIKTKTQEARSKSAHSWVRAFLADAPSFDQPGAAYQHDSRQRLRNVRDLLDDAVPLLLFQGYVVLLWILPHGSSYQIHDAEINEYGTCNTCPSGGTCNFQGKGLEAIGPAVDDDVVLIF